MFFANDAQRQVFCRLLFGHIPEKEGPIGDCGSTVVLRAFISDVWKGTSTLTVRDLLMCSSAEMRQTLLGAIVALHQGETGVERWIQENQFARAKADASRELDDPRGPAPAAPNGPAPNPVQPQVPQTPLPPQVGQ